MLKCCCGFCLRRFVVITLMYLVFDVKNETDLRIGVPDTMDPTFTEELPENIGSADL